MIMVTDVSCALLLRFTQTSPATEPVSFGSSEPLKVLLTAQEDGKAKRPHQAFLVLREPSTGLEAPFPLIVKESGKAVVEIVRIPYPTYLHTLPGMTIYLPTYPPSYVTYQRNPSPPVRYKPC